MGVVRSKVGATRRPESRRERGSIAQPAQTLHKDVQTVLRIAESPE